MQYCKTNKNRDKSVTGLVTFVLIKRKYMVTQLKDRKITYNLTKNSSELVSKKLDIDLKLCKTCWDTLYKVGTWKHLSIRRLMLEEFYRNFGCLESVFKLRCEKALLRNEMQFGAFRSLLPKK